MWRVFQIALFTSAPLLVQGQALVQLGDLEMTGKTGGPAIELNKRNPLNIVVAAPDGSLYTSQDGGKLWEQKAIPFPYGNLGESVLVADQKGTFYFFHGSNAVGEATTSGNKGTGFLCHVSGDGGRTWDEGHPVGFQESYLTKRPNATVDSKGNIHFSWVELENAEASECKSRLMLSSSSNGKKWSKPIIIAQNTYGCDQPAISGGTPCITDDKRVLISWSADGSIFLDRSFDGGSMWLSNDIPIIKHSMGGDPKIPGHANVDGSPVLFADRTKSERNGLLFITYADAARGANDSDVWLLRSNNFGDNWTTTIRVNDDTTKTHQYAPASAIDNTTGYVYVAFLDRRSNDGLTNVYLAYSKDSGGTFRNTPITTKGFRTEGVFPSKIGISAHKGVVAIVWAEGEENSKNRIITATIRSTDLP